MLATKIDDRRFDQGPTQVMKLSKPDIPVSRYN
jgi:hypothetical protein